MATCKQCLHYDACKGILDAIGIEMDAECPNQENLCKDFVGCTVKNTTTNADRIQAMSDEKLAKWIDWLFGRCEWCDTDKMATDDCNDVECTSCILE